MSRKIDAFRTAIPQPLTKKDITLLSPQLITGAMIAQAMSFPAEDMQEVEYYYMGRPLYTPTRTKVQGDWTVDIPDSMVAFMRYHLMDLLYQKRRFNISLIPGDLTELLGGVLGGDISGLLRAATSSAMAALLAGITLCDGWVKSVGAVDFSSGGATEPVVWRVTIRYNYIKPFIKLF